jgi:hypothetical protein
LEERSDAELVRGRFGCSMSEVVFNLRLEPEIEDGAREAGGEGGRSGGKGAKRVPRI